MTAWRPEPDRDPNLVEHEEETRRPMRSASFSQDVLPFAASAGLGVGCVGLFGGLLYFDAFVPAALLALAAGPAAFVITMFLLLNRYEDRLWSYHWERRAWRPQPAENHTRPETVTNGGRNIKRSNLELADSRLAALALMVLRDNDDILSGRRLEAAGVISDRNREGTVLQNELVRLGLAYRHGQQVLADDALRVYLSPFLPLPLRDKYGWPSPAVVQPPPPAATEGQRDL